MSNFENSPQMKNIPGSAPGSAAPQCGKISGKTEEPQYGKISGKTEEPQCGKQSYKTEEPQSGSEINQNVNLYPQVHHEWYSRGYLPHFDVPRVIQHITYRLVDSLPDSVLEQMQSEIKILFQEEEKRKIELRQRIETYLDSGHGSCILQEPHIASCVVDTWRRFDGERYRLLEWVVMPNHCHVMIEPFEGFPLAKIVLSWKNYTARFINEYRRCNVNSWERPWERRTPVRQDTSPNYDAPVQQEISPNYGVPVQQETSPNYGASVRRKASIQQENQGKCRSGERRSQQVWQREYWDRYIRNEKHFEIVKSYIEMNPVKAGLVLKPEEWLWSSAHSRVKQDTSK